LIVQSHQHVSKLVYKKDDKADLFLGPNTPYHTSVKNNKSVCLVTSGESA